MKISIVPLFVGCLCFGSGAAIQAEDRRPNILVILADDLGVGDLAVQGAADMRTPHLDALAASGMRFDRFYANCPVCSPTRAALLTGRYQELVGVPGVIRTHPENSWGRLRDDAVLLPTLLAPAGYHTAIIGKWHLGLEAPDRPTDRGFGFFKGYLGDMMDDYYTHRRHGINYMREGTREIDPKGHATDLFTTWAAEYIKSRAEMESPWVLYLAYNAPHTPIQPPPEWLEKVKKREPERNDRRAKLVALIEQMDHGVGEVMGALEQSGQRDDTLVIFTSDNGGQLSVGADNGPWRGGKQETYEGGIRVPAFVSWPGVVDPGTRNDAQLLSMDIFPTVCQAGGVSVPGVLDGVSFLPIIRGESSTLRKRRDVFFTRREGGERYMGECIWAMRRGDWKLVKNSPFQPWELFNMKSDPGETNNLAEKNRKKFRELAAAMRAHIQRGGAVPWQNPEGP